MAASEKSVKLTKALDLIGVSLKEWNKTPEEKRGELFKSSMDKTLEQLKEAMKDPKLDAAVKNEHEANISLIKEVFGNEDLKKTEADIPLDPIMAPPEKKDLGGKSWQDIMNEFLALPTDEELAYYKKTLETIKKNVDTVTDRDPRLKKFKEDINDLLDPTKQRAESQAQKEIYFSKLRAIDDAPNLTPEQKKTAEEALIREIGPMGHKIKDAVIKNDIRKLAEAVKKINPEMQPAPNTTTEPKFRIEQQAGSADKTSHVNASTNAVDERGTEIKPGPGLGGSA